MSERLLAAPLAGWVQTELARLEAEGTPSANEALAGRLGISVRQLYRWAHEVDDLGRPRFVVPAEATEDALHRAGVHLWEVWPWISAERVEHEDRFCPRCREYVTVTSDDGACPWCEARTVGDRRREQRWCRACDRARYPDNTGRCPTCGEGAEAMPHEPCACGCGELVRRFDRWGVRRRWRPGHAPSRARNRGQSLPAGPFANYLRERVREADPVAAVAQEHRMPREVVMALINGRLPEVSRGEVADALHRARQFGQRRGAPRRLAIPGLRELYAMLVCPACGSRKAVHAELCRRCRDAENRREGLAPPRTRDLLSEEIAERARRLGAGKRISWREAARRLLPSTSYSGERSLANALRRRLGD